MHYEEEYAKKGKILFSEFCDISPYQVEVTFKVDNDKVKEEKNIALFKEKHTNELNKISKYDEKLFPNNGFYLSNNLIKKIAERNENNEIIKNERFTIWAIRKRNLLTHENKLVKNIKPRKDVKKKTMNVKPKKYILSDDLSESQLTMKKSFLQPINENKKLNLIKDDDIFKKEEKIKLNKINDKNEKYNIQKSSSSNKSEENKEDEKINEKTEVKYDNNFAKNNANNVNNINNSNNTNNINDIKREYTLKDLLKSDSGLSIKDNKIDNNSKISSVNESFSIMKDNKKTKVLKFEENIIKEDYEKNRNENEEIKTNEEKIDEINSIRLYSDNENESNSIKNQMKIDLTFSSKKS